MSKYFKKVYTFFDKLEDRIRAKLSHYPLIYALIGGIGVVLFWRGVWHSADQLKLNDTISVIIGIVLLLITGLFASVFIGDQIVISGIKHEKKVTERTEEEVETERDMLLDIKKDIKEIEQELEEIRKKEKV